MTPIQQGDIEMSLAWKKNSHRIFDAVKNKSDFHSAVRWCGAYSAVARTVRREKFEDFADWLFSNLDDIKKGTFSFETAKTSGFVKCEALKDEKYPKSWVSKICHIINPQDYPLIWDTHVNKYLKNNKITWDKAINDAKNNYKTDVDTIYRYDSTLWLTKP